MQYQKIALIAVLLIVAVFATTTTTTYIYGCLYAPGASIPYYESGAPFYIVASVMSLARYNGLLLH